MSVWLEVQAPDRKALVAVYALADACGCESIHHFNEPWYPDGAVVRVLLPKAGEKVFEDSTWSVVRWDASPDEHLYGDLWPKVRDLFEAASRLAVADPSGEIGELLDLKVIHCILNTWGYSAMDEAAFSARFVRNRWKIVRKYEGGSLRERLAELRRSLAATASKVPV